jgi:hypothetical protein
VSTSREVLLKKLSVEDGSLLVCSAVQTCIVLMMEAERSFETSVNSCQPTRHYNPEDSHLHSHRCENLKLYSANFCLVSFGIFGFLWKQKVNRSWAKIGPTNTHDLATQKTNISILFWSLLYHILRRKVVPHNGESFFSSWRCTIWLKLATEAWTE